MQRGYECEIPLWHVSLDVIHLIALIVKLNPKRIYSPIPPRNVLWLRIFYPCVEDVHRSRWCHLPHFTQWSQFFVINVNRQIQSSTSKLEPVLCSKKRKWTNPSNNDCMYINKPLKLAIPSESLTTWHVHWSCGFPIHTLNSFNILKFLIWIKLNLHTYGRVYLFRHTRIFALLD